MNSSSKQSLVFLRVSFFWEPVTLMPNSIFLIKLSLPPAAYPEEKKALMLAGGVSVISDLAYEMP
jgi:hypothetical protein